MDPNYIKPFIASIQNVFSTMLQLPVTVGDPRIKSGMAPEHDISGIIGMSGDVIGNVVLSFKLDSAVAIVSLFCGQKLEPGTPDFADAVGELVNMVSGNAKALFKDRKVSISCPSVIIGNGHHVARPSDVPCVVIPCSTDCGEVTIEVAIKERTGVANTNAPAAAKA